MRLEVRYQRFSGTFHFHHPKEGRSSEMFLTIYQTTQSHIIEDCNFNTHCFESLKLPF
jgi:hypothetical protein